MSPSGNKDNPVLFLVAAILDMISSVKNPLVIVPIGVTWYLWWCIWNEREVRDCGLITKCPQNTKNPLREPAEKRLKRGPVYKVSGTRDNPPPEIPWAS